MVGWGVGVAVGVAVGCSVGGEVGEGVGEAVVVAVGVASGVGSSAGVVQAPRRMAVRRKVAKEGGRFTGDLPSCRRLSMRFVG